ncbi:6-phospho-beta-glucosidase [Streptoalloteichus tenebrarius]|uniref:6-phospho-beta-glucosidase n=1 Tax=Streptoalloteichus tenebrarius (strain ATCC 17920 / DSM 40477 / JCM 4838 / CBS 697.72 / NBRC 16177 / NCIMB 11028 / NRRL B-12390 / A12253. 1 / ISP 5477) TaxID=1933 RepID=A0ABT1HU55_STRSD|nr:6-phospho-beta-glucosidase [Streptoalloteichus tenebrarius]
MLGGGGFRVPLVHASLLADPDRLVDELVLCDRDERRLTAITAVLDQQAAGAATRPALTWTTDVDHAVAGADVVFSAIRVGGTRGRTLDERVALDQGLLGQETVGPGGISYALRTVPVALDIARRVATAAPGAWLINFTNPAGLVTEAMTSVLGDRVIGICDSPVGLCRGVAAALGVEHERCGFDYVGLNHLGWLRRVLVDGRDRLPELLADDTALARFEEGRLFGPALLRALGAVPNEYLHYYYFARETLREAREQERTRGEFLRDQQERFYARAIDNPRDALRLWEETRAERERTYMAESRAVAGAGERPAEALDGGGYDRVALRLMKALGGGGEDRLILNVRNRNAVAEMPADAVVEVPCVVDRNGARPLAVGAVEPHFLALMRQVKTVERAAITAATTRSRAHALLALVSHPLVDSAAAAERALDGYAAAFPELADLA